MRRRQVGNERALANLTSLRSKPVSLSYAVEKERHRRTEAPSATETAAVACPPRGDTFGTTEAKETALSHLACSTWTDVASRTLLHQPASKPAPAGRRQHPASVVPNKPFTEVTGCHNDARRGRNARKNERCANERRRCTPRPSHVVSCPASPP